MQLRDRRSRPSPGRVDPLRYLGSVISTAASRSIDIAQWIIFVLILSIAALSLFVPTIKTRWDLNSGQVGLFVLCTVVGVRLIGAPYWLYEEMKAQRDQGQKTIVALGQERPLSYDNTTFLIHPHDQSWDVIVTVYFTNSGTHMLKWRMVRGSLEMNGVTIPPLEASRSYFVNQGQRAWFRYPGIQNVPCNQLPVVVNLMFEVEYDNDPPIKPRVTKRAIRYSLLSASGTAVLAEDVDADER